MTLKINSLAPDFKAKTQMGDISFHEWLGDVYKRQRIVSANIIFT